MGTCPGPGPKASQLSSAEMSLGAPQQLLTRRHRKTRTTTTVKGQDAWEPVLLSVKQSHAGTYTQEKSRAEDRAKCVCRQAQGAQLEASNPSLDHTCKLRDFRLLGNQARRELLSHPPGSL